jgi:lysophospholipase L1-like esterase
MGRKRAAVAALVGALVVACAGPPMGSSGTTRASTGSAKRLNYVAVGDSFAAAPGVPDPAPPAGCRKSTNDYPSILARELDAISFVDVTCSGAKTADITTRAQRTTDGPVARQIDAVDASVDLITVTIGANDIGLPSDAKGCQVESDEQPPCTNKFVVNNVDRISQVSIAQLPAWAGLVDQLRAAAPHARIVFVGYGTYVRPGGCFPAQPVLPRDADYLQSKLNELDDLQQQLAAEKGIDYFDTRPLSDGHDICADPGDRYIEGFVTVGSAEPLHPNAFGEKAVGTALAGYLARPVARG